MLGQVSYLIDLHVFLGRKFSPATRQSASTTDGIYGMVPQVSHGSQAPAASHKAAPHGSRSTRQSILDVEREAVESTLHGSVELQNLHRVMQNGYKLYDKCGRRWRPCKPALLLPHGAHG